MRTAGGRLFVDVTPMLASPATRNGILESMGKSDPLIKDALQTVVERGDFLPSPPEAGEGSPGPGGGGGGAERGHALLGQNTLIENDPEIAAGLIRRSQASLAELERTIGAKSGPELFDFIREDLQELKRILTDPQSLRVIMAAMDASIWINDKVEEWLGEKNAADTLSLSVPGNVTSEMGLALLEVADAVRPFPEVVDYLRRAKDPGFLEGLDGLPGGRGARGAIHGFLDRYGMRCVGEIDITRTRWGEQPATLIPLILSNVRNFEPGAGRRKLEQGGQEALEKERDILERLRRLPEGGRKAEETKRRIDLIRTFAGYREYPKYAMVSRYYAYKRALRKEALALVRAGAIRAEEDIHYLTFEELGEAVRTGRVDDRTLGDRKEEYRAFGRLTPPRVITSEGEALSGRYRRERLPEGAIVGLPVSAGVAEGRARVLLRMEEADLEEGDILVTAFTDPSWTPLFVAIKGLVTEVGGLMTHGAVIAREYGLPAVVGVENATRLIKDGQRIRVHGAEGYVEIL
jgi:phosphoenolpyruvate synthase/pyruvate phosphate dikinase